MAVCDLTRIIINVCELTRNDVYKANKHEKITTDISDKIKFTLVYGSKTLTNERIINFLIFNLKNSTVLIEMQSKLGERSTWIEKRLYKEHKNRLKNAKSKVDHKAPLLNVDAYYNSSTMKANAIRLTQIDENNLKLIKEINTTYRMGGKVDCSTPIILDKIVPSKPPMEDSNKKIYKENISLLTKIDNAKARIDFNKFKKDRKIIEKIMLSMCKHPEYYKRKKKSDPLVINAKIPKDILLKKSKCFMDIKNLTENWQQGRLIIELYDDVVPKTAFNFMTLCQQRKDKPSYRGTQFFCINPGLFCVGGDVEYSLGLGGVSVYDERYFNDENYVLSHNAPGTLSMFSFEKNKNASQFLITFKPLRSLDNNHVVFGRVIRGWHTLGLIENSGLPSGKPKHKIIINNCGQLIEPYSKTSGK